MSVAGTAASFLNHEGSILPNTSQTLSGTQSNTSPSSSSQEDTHNDENTERGEALEWAQVIELQAFSERKAWIEEKTRLLERMPPVEVFIALDSLRSGSEEVSSGLPTRAELRQWVAEHDRIEKETEIFDAGEFRKLKKFTKAAAQRNLSPADTDLIELTLTTIYDLDKLLHLLRGRSEQLDLLDVRLRWEEQRRAAWTDYRKIIKDLNTFLTTRAQWSPNVYDSVMQDRPSTNERPSRRGSVTSIASVDSSSSTSPANLSRSTRFKLAEILSKEAAQISTRVSSLRHSKISVAGKALDKLIDDSQKPVPDVLLDEQDRLETKGITELEDVGQFVMSVVLQWKKADEIYVENKKDQAAAQMLIEEIETAKMSHPQARQDVVLVSRANALTKRLSQPGEFASVANTVLCPVHPLFPDQETSNAVIAETLSSELASSLYLAKKVEVLAKEYHASYEAVNRVEALCGSAEEYLVSFDSLVRRLENGVDAPDGDGTPPKLDDISCLVPTTHSAFLALFPSLLNELDGLTARVDKTTQDFTVALLRLNMPNIDHEFKARAKSTADQLSARKAAVQLIRDQVVSRVHQLRQVRKIRSSLDDTVETLEGLQQDIDDGIRRDKWNPKYTHNSAPLTPESSMELLPAAPTTPADVLQKLDDLQSTDLDGISSSLAPIAPTLPANLREWMMQDLAESKAMIDSLKRTTHFWEAIRNQSSTMDIVMDEANSFRVRLEDLGSAFEEYIDTALDMNHSEQELVSTQERLVGEERELREGAQVIIDGLSRRVPFVSNNTSLSRSFATHGRRYSSLSGKAISVSNLRQQNKTDLPVDPLALDNTVRDDCNQLTMALSGAVQSLQAKVNNLQLAHVSNAVEKSLRALNDNITRIANDVSARQSSFNAQKPVDLDQLAVMAEHLNHQFAAGHAEINRSFSHVRELITQMNNTPNNHDTGVYERMVLPKSRATKEAETRFNVLEKQVLKFKAAIAESRRVEQERLAEIARLEDEKREREIREEERRRQQAKEEQERREEEERAKVEADEKRRVMKEMRRQEEERQERERKEAEERERITKEKARQEEERLALAEKERKEQEDLRRKEMERQQKDVEERERKKREDAKRKEAEERDRITKERARQEEERSALAEKERKGQEDLRRKEMERQQKDVEEREQKKWEDTERKEAEEKEREAMTSWRISLLSSESNSCSDDVFGFRLAPAAEISTKNNEMVDLQSRIFHLRKRLRSLSVGEVIRPTSSTRPLPNNDVRDRIVLELSTLTSQASELPDNVTDLSVDAELKSLRTELSATSQMLDTLHKLADFSYSVGVCDTSLSDLLEHIDSYPSLPMGPLSSVHVSDRTLPPKEQLSARLSFTQSSVHDIQNLAATFSDDIRVTSEQDRILQAWSELKAMGKDLLSSQKSQPPSSMSSVKGPSKGSRASLDNNHRKHRKAESYARLSAGRMSTDGLLLPPHPNIKRSISNSSMDSRERSSSSLSVSSRASSTRSVSGPMPGTSNHTSRLHSSTFSSRQRTTSLSSNAPPIFASSTLSRSRAQTGQFGYRQSPSPSETSSLSRSVISISTGPTWTRALRQSLPSSSRPSTPRRQKAKQPKRPYIPDPANKLDVAVGDVVNKLPININVEVVADTWKDKSGKYWIGDQEPKLCFCRILRSQTVMVRVGGGWQELSKFINDHFADLYRLFPTDSPKRGNREEKWISAATLRAAEACDGPLPPPPRTPEPNEDSLPSLPSFAFSTPSGRSPHSVKSTPSTGSPLTPLQFMRRADMDSFQRPETPLKSPSIRPRSIIPGTPRQPAWRP